MKIIALVENTSISNNYTARHGLSLYIEACGHNILFDLGPDHLFIENAKKLGVDISKVDTVVISHGHVDHGGGLRLFLEQNTHAKVYVRKEAFEGHYTKVLGIPFHIGLDSFLITHNQVILTEEVFTIDENLILFSNVKNHDFFPKSNQALYKKIEQGYLRDDFSHEQSLIIKEKGNTVLVSGCAHCGILNIQKKGNTLIEGSFDFVVSGMHLFNPVLKKYESDDFISALGKKLAMSQTKYFTCHCTGEKSMSKLLEHLENRIEYLHTGSVWNL